MSVTVTLTEDELHALTRAAICHGKRSPGAPYALRTVVRKLIAQMNSADAARAVRMLDAEEAA